MNVCADVCVCVWMHLWAHMNAFVRTCIHTYTLDILVRSLFVQSPTKIGFFSKRVHPQARDQ